MCRDIATTTRTGVPIKPVKCLAQRPRHRSSARVYAVQDVPVAQQYSPQRDEVRALPVILDIRLPRPEGTAECDVTVETGRLYGHSCGQRACLVGATERLTAVPFDHGHFAVSKLRELRQHDAPRGVIKPARLGSLVKKFRGVDRKRVAVHRATIDFDFAG